VIAPSTAARVDERIRVEKKRARRAFFVTLGACALLLVFQVLLPQVHLSWLIGVLGAAGGAVTGGLYTRTWRIENAAKYPDVPSTEQPAGGDAEQ